MLKKWRIFFIVCLLLQVCTISHAYNNDYITNNDYGGSGGSFITLGEALTLYPQDSDLRFAPNVIVEPRYEPYNLGGWKTFNVVMFPLSVQKQGVYDVSIVYSKHDKHGSTGKLGVFAPTTLSKNPSSAPNFSLYLPPTGHNWQRYRYMHLGSIRLARGSVYLTFQDLARYQGQYVMNLREVHLERRR